MIGLLQRIGGWLEAAAGALATLSLWAMALIVFLDVALRFLGAPTLWASEVSVYLILVLAFIGAGATQAADGHFRVSFFRDLMSARVRRWLDLIAFASVVVFAALFSWGAWQLVVFSRMLDFRTPTILKAPLWALQSLLLVGGVLLAIAALRMLVLRMRSPRETPASGGPDSREVI